MTHLTDRRGRTRELGNIERVQRPCVCVSCSAASPVPSPACQLCVGSSWHRRDRCLSSARDEPGGERDDTGLRQPTTTKTFPPVSTDTWWLFIPPLKAVFVLLSINIMYLPLRKLLGQSPSGTRSPPDPVECVSDAETLSLSSRAESAACVSAGHRRRFLKKTTLCVRHTLPS